ncbi:MAG: hypothetical protein KAI43_13620 [Candidatus Aureabacteria bacterium]|nr:hypothetical protein [Candidatus Auribacterota bacterium]
MKLKWKNRLMTVFLIVFSISFLIPVSNLNGQEEDSISIDFVDADIADVIRVLATARNLNYIIGEQVIGTVTIKLDDVSFNSALDAVITSNGFGYKIVENVLTVNTISKLKEQADIKQMIVSKQELLTFVFELKYINADDVIPILKNELSSRGKIFSLKKTIRGGYKGGELSASAPGLKSSEREKSEKEEVTRILVVSDIPEKIERIQMLISRLDFLPPQVLIDTKIVEMTMDDTFDFGIKWDFLGGGEKGDGGLIIGSSKASKVISDDLTNTKERTLSGNDTRKVSPNTNADLISLSSKDKRDNPLSYDSEELFKDSTGVKLMTDPVTGYSIVDYTTSGKMFDSEQEIIDITSIGRTLSLSNVETATLSVSDFNVVLNALKANDNTEIISNPTILTLHNHEASILVGERVPILKSTTVDTTTTETLDRYEPVGVYLQVVPQVMADGYVKLVIRPSVTSIGPEVKGSTGYTVNRLLTREASTQAIVKSSETVVIGGLIKERTVKKISKLPILGDIPILGWAFKNKRDAVEKVNLMIFVTPTIIERQ